MKLGISYNVFDGEELLEYSLLSVRQLAEHISVVYQTTSNYGQENKGLLSVLEKLQDRGLIDKLFKYTPKNFSMNFLLEHRKGGRENIKINNEKVKDLYKNGTLNEIEKRDIGLQIAKANKCDCFMTMDADEIYDTNKLQFALDTFEVGGYDSSFCKMQTFYKLPTLKIPNESYYVPLFYKINKHSRINFIDKSIFPVFCDPTRRMIAGYCKVFTREEIEMYHYSYVRKDIASKIYNSSAQKDKKIQKIVIDHFNNWKSIEQGAKLLGGDSCELIEVENKFNIKI